MGVEWGGFWRIGMNKKRLTYGMLQRMTIQNFEKKIEAHLAHCLYAALGKFFSKRNEFQLELLSFKLHLLGNVEESQQVLYDL